MNYGIDDIKSLDFREGVRTRIQMYLGSDDNEGTYQALKEIINKILKYLDYNLIMFSMNYSQTKLEWHLQIFSCE